MFVPVSLVFWLLEATILPGNRHLAFESAFFRLTVLAATIVVAPYYLSKCWDELDL